MSPVAAGPGRGPSSYSATDFSLSGLVEDKAGRRLTLCLPARDEEATVGEIVAIVRRELQSGVPLVDEIIVVDDGSHDATAAVSLAAGARVVAGTGAGKGEAMQLGLAAAEGELVAFCDADIRSFSSSFVVGLFGPLLAGHALFVKGFYRRPLDGRPAEGGRVTELVAKPLLRTLYPALAPFAQPLAGECAAARALFEQLPFVCGYGVDIALLIDVAQRFGTASMAQVDLGARVHRNRPLAELGPQAEAVLRTALWRAGVGEPLPQRAALAGPAAPGRLTA